MGDGKREIFGESLGLEGEVCIFANYRHGAQILE